MKQSLIGLLIACFVGAFDASITFAKDRGSVTGRPLPRFVSMKATEGNVRRGPSRTHQIDWVFKHRDMPLQITAEFGHWRRVQDRDGLGGWMHYSLLSGVRTVIIEQNDLELHVRADGASPVVVSLEMEVIARVSQCGVDWCRLQADGYKGWAPKSAMWGIGAEELLK